MTYKQEIFEYVKAEYGVEPEYPWQDDSSSCVFKEKISDKWFMLFMSIRKRKLGIDSDDFVDVINVKAEPDFISFVAGTPGVHQAYHMNKRHWLTIMLDGTIASDDIKDFIDRSYNLIANTPTRRIYEAVKRIPNGHVATYGQVAQMAGDKKMARAVGNALHKNPDPDNIPCFRVVNSKGELAGAFAFGGAEVQANLLRKDGVEVVNNMVDLAKYGINVDEVNA